MEKTIGQVNLLVYWCREVGYGYGGAKTGYYVLMRDLLSMRCGTGLMDDIGAMAGTVFAQE